MEQWFVINKKADFQAIGEEFGIDQVTARIIRNRDIVEREDIQQFLRGGMNDLCAPHLMKDADRLTEILVQKIKEKAAIRIIGDYDIDGVMATHILLTALRRAGADVSAAIPDRIRDGYGLNENLILRAREDGIDTILTCDNGIAAIDEIALAKELGMTVLVTDHHEIPYTEEGGERRYKTSAADAVVNPHQKDCPYPFKELCGAAVAWKVVCVLYEKSGIPAEEADALLEYVAFATVGDIMELTGENRILVKEGLKRIRHTKNIGMRALIAQCRIEPSEIEAYHFGFVLGPCINASGRLDTARRALELFSMTEETEALVTANELVVLNMERKDLTAKAVEDAVRIYEENGYDADPVIVLYLPKVHESIAGIVAGRIRERYYKPTFILTKAEDGVKGSGRSVEEYSMYEQMCRCQELFTRFGGHPMAAGLSLPEENVELFREKINELCPQECRGLTAKIRIDVPMPLDYVSFDLVNEFRLLAPFGKGNPRPVFADKDLLIERIRVMGKKRNVVRLNVRTASGTPAEAVWFGESEEFLGFLEEKFGKAKVEKALAGAGDEMKIAIVYYPKINVFRNEESLQFEIQAYR